MTTKDASDSSILRGRLVTDHPALLELCDIVKIEGTSSVNGTNARLSSLKAWIDKWVVDCSVNQSVVSTKYLSTEYEDVLKYKLGVILGELLSENCVDYDLKNKVINAKMIGIRRSG